MEEIRQALNSDIGRIMEIIQEAKERLKSQNIDQWQSGYPNRESIEGDILSHSGFVIIQNDEIAGYMCVSFDGEACYNNIHGQWKSVQPFGVIHRMAVSDRHKGYGLSKKMFKFAEKLCMSKDIKSIKVDTDSDNTAMGHILQKNGYEYCGTVQFDNSDKVAFEKIL